jgi:hypothetical protein
MNEQIPNTGPIEGLITLETLRNAIVDAMDRKGPAELAFLVSRRDEDVKGAVTGVEIDEDDDVVLLFDTRGAMRLDRLSIEIEGICDASRRQMPVFIKHLRLGVIAGAVVGAGPDADGDLSLRFDFIEDALAQHADELARYEAEAA